MELEQIEQIERKPNKRILFLLVTGPKIIFVLIRICRVINVWTFENPTRDGWGSQKAEKGFSRAIKGLQTVPKIQRHNLRLFKA